MQHHGNRLPSLVLKNKATDANLRQYLCSKRCDETRLIYFCVLDVYGGVRNSFFF